MAHTSRYTDDMFQVAIDGLSGSRDDLFGKWTCNDRFGIVVHEPMGAMGASCLINLAVVAYYESVRAAGSEFRLHYPELYVFHVGRLQGDHSFYDAWPPRKEVLVNADPADVLAKINQLGITFLAVPDATARQDDHWWGDIGSAVHRLRGCFAYSSSGRVVAGDVEIRGVRVESDESNQFALRPLSLVEMADTVDDPELVAYGSAVLARLDEISEVERQEILARHDATLVDGLPVESYRRLAVDEALGLLVPDSSVDPQAGRRQTAPLMGAQGPVPRASWGGGPVAVERLLGSEQP